MHTAYTPNLIIKDHTCHTTQLMHTATPHTPPSSCLKPHSTPCTQLHAYRIHSLASTTGHTAHTTQLLLNATQHALYSTPCIPHTPACIHHRPHCTPDPAPAGHHRLNAPQRLYRRSRTLVGCALLHTQQWRRQRLKFESKPRCQCGCRWLWRTGWRCRGAHEHRPYGNDGSPVRWGAHAGVCGWMGVGVGLGERRLFCFMGDGTPAGGCGWVGVSLGVSG
jgi:hypothetical protein